MRLEEFLSAKAAKKTFSEGDLIFKQGEVAQAAFYIVSGKVEIFKTVMGRDSVLIVLEAGDIFGEMGLLRFDEYTLSARALEDTETSVITPELLQEQIRETHPLVKAILDMLIDRIHNLNQVLIDLDSTAKK